MKITSITLAELSQLLQKPFKGNPDTVLTGVNEIHMVEPGDITFVDHQKYYEKALNSQATAVIINKEVEVAEGKCIIISEAPFDDYNFLAKKFAPVILSNKNIHETAKIGKNTFIAPNVSIGANCIIGNNCIIHPNVTIYNDTIIGNDVEIHAGAVIGSHAFYFKKKTTGFEKMHSCGRTIIHDEVEIGANCTIDKGVSGDTIIGKNTKLDNGVHIGHDTVIGERCLIAAQVGIAGVVKIEDEVILWGKVGVQKDLTIGKGAVVLGYSGVSKTLEGGKTYFGAPAEDARRKWREMAFIKQLFKNKDQKE